MSNRNSILVWSEQGRLKDTRAALRAAEVLPTQQDWRIFLDRLLLWSGTASLAASVIFFVAYNWQELGKFAKFGLVEALILAAIFGYWRIGAERTAGKALLFAAATLMGALLALFGQTYQTGADTWQLFATWAALITPLVCVGRLPGLWILWFTITNTALILYFRVFPQFFGFWFNTEHQFWAVFVFNTGALAVWEAAAARLAWMAERSAPRLLAITGGVTLTWLAITAIFDWRSESGSALLVYPVWLAGLYLVYRRLKTDLLVLAGACLSIIVVVTCFLTRTLLEHHGDPGALLFIAMVVIGMAAASGWWLKRIAGEDRI